jgi:hypothetical protein
MGHERSNGGPGAGRGRDDVDDFSEPEEPTVVIASETFVLDAVARVSGGLRRAADRNDELESVVEQVGAAAAIDDLIEEYEELEILMGGLCRALRRVRASVTAKGERTT